MTLRQRLIIAFMGIAIVVLGIFGVMAFYISTEFAAESEIHFLADIAADKAAILSRQLGGKTRQQQDAILTTYYENATLPIILIDDANTIVAVSAATRELDFGQLADYIKTRPGLTGGIVKLAQDDLMWGLAPVPGTDYTLVFFHPGKRDLSFFRALGVKLFFAALLVIWVTVWAALIIASVIGRRLDEQNAVLVHQSLHDALTDLPNRNLMCDRIQQAIYYYRREGLPVALFLIELNHIKDINDTLGHSSGDAVLKQIGPRLQEALWEPDTIARLDGGEFAILLPRVNRDKVSIVANKILKSLEKPFVVDDLELETGAAIGVAIFPDHGDDPETLIRQADVAMCLAKKHSCEYMVYTPESDPHSIQQLTLIADLRQAINKNELELYYQPKVDLKTQRTIGAEALLRWHHPERGEIPPDEFIPRAEQTGLIKPLTRWVIEEALRQGHVWEREGLHLAIAINVSQRSLYDRELINQIADTMQRLRIKSCTLDLEITETAIMAHPEQSLITLHELDAMGINLSIDDFGTGFTSLAYLKELPVTELKIDKSFVINMLNDGKDIMIVRSIIELAHSLGRVVVAEGVESKEVMELLQTLNCDTAQGYYLSKPLPVKEFEEWLKSSDWDRPDNTSRFG